MKCINCGKLTKNQKFCSKKCSAKYLYKIRKFNLKHGLSTSKFYQCWNNIKTRCNNKNNKDYKRYGGRGIKIEWDSFESFEKDMYNSYLKHKNCHDSTTIERVDVDGDYCKDNCIWITKSEQSKNRRSNIKYKEIKLKEEENINRFCDRTIMPGGYRWMFEY